MHLSPNSRHISNLISLEGWPQQTVSFFFTSDPSFGLLVLTTVIVVIAIVKDLLLYLELELRETGEERSSVRDKGQGQITIKRWSQTLNLGYLALSSRLFSL